VLLGSNEDDEVVTRSLLATLKVLVNITHDNGMCSLLCSVDVSVC